MIAKLSTDREILQHPGAKGTATELHWLQVLGDYLPRRYCVDKAFALDCEGRLSEEIDLVIYDRQYSPFLFNQDGAKYVPAESVYAVLEIKQDLCGEHIAYAGVKAASVRRLKRTSAPVPYVAGKYGPKTPQPILAGILTLDSAWAPPLGDPFVEALGKLATEERLDLGCVLKQAGFEISSREDGRIQIETSANDSALVFFFVRLLARLQEGGTVPAMDLREYGRVL